VHVTETEMIKTIMWLLGVQKPGFLWFTEPQNLFLLFLKQ